MAGGRAGGEECSRQGTRFSEKVGSFRGHTALWWSVSEEGAGGLT